jgi:hypothetical protein
MLPCWPPGSETRERLKGRGEHATTPTRRDCHGIDTNGGRHLTYRVMHFAKSILLAILAVALGSYAFDCEAAPTREQAMQCCNSMRCSSHHHHGMDCCKSMPNLHAPFVQPSSAQSHSFAPVVFAVVSVSGELSGSGCCAQNVAAHCHAPPLLPSPAPCPLRV